MFDENREIQFQILQALADSPLPRGAGAIQVALSEASIDRSEAAIGRYLRQFQRQGWVERIGFQGQVITETGRKELEKLRIERLRQGWAQDLIGQIRSGKTDVFIDLLHARRAIEGEAARLAALRATDEDLEELSRNIADQKESIDRKRTNAPFNKAFHELLVDLSHNDILKTMYQLIKMDVDWAHLFEEIQQRRGSQLGVGHYVIYEALCRREPEAAREAAISHIDSIIDDARKVLREFQE